MIWDSQLWHFGLNFPTVLYPQRCFMPEMWLKRQREKGEQHWTEGLILDVKDNATSRDAVRHPNAFWNWAPDDVLGSSWAFHVQIGLEITTWAEFPLRSLWFSYCMCEHSKNRVMRKKRTILRIKEGKSGSSGHWGWEEVKKSRMLGEATETKEGDALKHGRLGDSAWQRDVI